MGCTANGSPILGVPSGYERQPGAATIPKRAFIRPAGVAISQASLSGKYVDRHAGFFIKSNLCGLCRQCHYVKTEEDKMHSGEWPSVITDQATTKVWSF